MMVTRIGVKRSIDFYPPFAALATPTRLPLSRKTRRRREKHKKLKAHIGFIEMLAGQTVGDFSQWALLSQGYYLLPSVLSFHLSFLPRQEMCADITC